MPEKTTGPFQLPPLPWEEGALAPAISARTIKSIRGGAPVHLPKGFRVSFSVGSQLSEAAKAPARAKKATKKATR